MRDLTAALLDLVGSVRAGWEKEQAVVAQWDLERAELTARVVALTSERDEWGEREHRLRAELDETKAALSDREDALTAELEAAASELETVRSQLTEIHAEIERGAMTAPEDVPGSSGRKPDPESGGLRAAFEAAQERQGLRRPRWADTLGGGETNRDDE